MPAEAAHAGDGALESASAEKSQVAALDVALPVADYEGKPTEEELATLRRVPGKLPTVAYLLCAVEFCERASYYGRSCEAVRADARVHAETHQVVLKSGPTRSTDLYPKVATAMDPFPRDLKLRRVLWAWASKSR